MCCSQIDFMELVEDFKDKMLIGDLEVSSTYNQSITIKMCYPPQTFPF